MSSKKKTTKSTSASNKKPMSWDEVKLPSSSSEKSTAPSLSSTQTKKPMTWGDIKMPSASTPTQPKPIALKPIPEPKKNLAMQGMDLMNEVMGGVGNVAKSGLDIAHKLPLVGNVMDVAGALGKKTGKAISKVANTKLPFVGKLGGSGTMLQAFEETNPKAGAVAKGAMDSATLGLSSLANTDFENKNMQDHPYLYGAGNLAGYTMPFGAVGKAVEGTRLAGEGLKKAIIDGAIVGGTQGLIEGKNPIEEATQLATLGVAGHLGMGALGKTFKVGGKLADAKIKDVRSKVRTSKFNKRPLATDIPMAKTAPFGVPSMQPREAPMSIPDKLEALRRQQANPSVLTGERPIMNVPDTRETVPTVNNVIRKSAINANIQRKGQSGLDFAQTMGRGVPAMQTELPSPSIGNNPISSYETKLLDFNSRAVKMGHEPVDMNAPDVIGLINKYRQQEGIPLLKSNPNFVNPIEQAIHDANSPVKMLPEPKWVNSLKRVPREGTTPIEALPPVPTKADIETARNPRKVESEVPSVVIRKERVAPKKTSVLPVAKEEVATTAETPSVVKKTKPVKTINNYKVGDTIVVKNSAHGITEGTYKINKIDSEFMHEGKKQPWVSLSGTKGTLLSHSPSFEEFNNLIKAQSEPIMETPRFTDAQLDGFKKKFEEKEAIEKPKREAEALRRKAEEDASDKRADDTIKDMPNEKILELYYKHENTNVEFADDILRAYLRKNIKESPKVESRKPSWKVEREKVHPEEKMVRDGLEHERSKLSIPTIQKRIDELQGKIDKSKSESMKAEHQKTISKLQNIIKERNKEYKVDYKKTLGDPPTDKNALKEYNVKKKALVDRVKKSIADRYDSHVKDYNDKQAVLNSVEFKEYMAKRLNEEADLDGVPKDKGSREGYSSSLLNKRDRRVDQYKFFEDAIYDEYMKSKNPLYKNTEIFKGNKKSNLIDTTESDKAHKKIMEYVEAKKEADKISKGKSAIERLNNPEKFNLNGVDTVRNSVTEEKPLAFKKAVPESEVAKPKPENMKNNPYYDEVKAKIDRLKAEAEAKKNAPKVNPFETKGTLSERSVFNPDAPMSKSLALKDALPTDSSGTLKDTIVKEKKNTKGEGKNVQTKLEGQLRDFENTIGRELGIDAKGKLELSVAKTEEHRYVEKLSKALGMDTIIYHAKDPSIDKLNGVYHNGKLFISDGSQNPLNTVFGHEFKHFLDDTDPALLRNFRKVFKEELDMTLAGAYKQVKMDYYKSQGIELTDKTFMEEAEADFFGEMKNDPKVMERVFAKDPTIAQSLVNSIMKYVKKIKRDVALPSQVTRYIDDLEKVQDAYVKVMREHIRKTNEARNANFQSKGINIKNGSASALNLSLKTLNEADRETIIKDMVDVGLGDRKKVLKYLKSLDNVAKQINDNKEVLDYKSNDVFSSVKPNSDGLYVVSVDFSTLCKKRYVLQSTIEAIQKQSGKALLGDEILKVRDALSEAGHEVSCLPCYVEAQRLKQGKFINEFMGDTKGNIEKFYQRKGYKMTPEEKASIFNLTGGESLKKLPKGVADQVRVMKKKFQGQYKLTPEQLGIIEQAKTIDKEKFLSSEGQTWLKENHPEVYDVLTTYVRERTKSKSMEARTSYKQGELLEKMSKPLIKRLNDNAGLRWQSWSDFEVPHLLDGMQVTVDMARGGMHGHAYTKVADFIRSFGKTGMMINGSLIPLGDGFKEGKLSYDPVEGFDYGVLQKLRDEYPETVGNIVIGANDKHVLALLKDPDIDFVIPYHISGLPKSVRVKSGLKDWRDYTGVQEETVIDKELNASKGGVESFPVKEWWDYEPLNKDGSKKTPAQITKNSVENYLRLSKENGLRPKFEEFKNEEGYWKLLIDRKMINHKTGETIVQKVVKPIFDDKVIGEVLENYKKSNPKGTEISKYVAEDIVKQFSGKSTKYSIKHGENPEFDKWFKDSKVVDKDGEPLKMYHGTDADFTIFDKAKIGSKTDGGDVGRGFYFIGDKEEAKWYGKKLGEYYVSIKNPLVVDNNYLTQVKANDTALRNSETPAPLPLIEELKKKFESVGYTIDKPLATKYRYMNMYDFVKNIGEQNFTDGLKKLNYDGVNWLGEWVAFESNQIKSATNNRGTFDANNPDTRYSIKIGENPEFDKWFGDSKIRDKDGEPLIVYHGSPNKGTAIFDTNASPIRTRSGIQGTYFTSDIGQASNYARLAGSKERGQVYHAYLKMDNPLDITKDIAKFKKQGMSFGDAKREALKKFNPEIHDGVIFKGDKHNSDEYAVVNPTQIKSATGNNGNFDGANPDIRYSMKVIDRNVVKTVADAPTPDAEIRTSVNNPTLVQRFISALHRAYNLGVDNVSNIKKVGKETYVTAMNSKLSGNIAKTIAYDGLVDRNGKPMGQSIKDLWESIPEGEEDSFWIYMHHRHNIARSANDVGVYLDYSSSDSKYLKRLYENENPTWKAKGDNIVKWIDTFQREWGVGSGIISQNLYNQLRMMYPDYVPTGREFTSLEKGVESVTGGKGFVSKEVPLKRAIGSDRNIAPTMEQLINMVAKTVKTAKYNEVGQMMLKEIRKNPSGFAEIIPKEDVNPNVHNIVTVLENGEPVYVKVHDEGLLRDLRNVNRVEGDIERTLKNVSGKYTALITHKNPVFATKNIMRDLPTAYINGSESNPLKFLNDVGKAGMDIVKNRDAYKQYKGVGGGGANLMAGDSARAVADFGGHTGAKKVYHAIVDRIESFNNTLESAPRLAEFKRQLDMHGDVQKALYEASDVTVNFSRGGNVTKGLNSGIPFLNAGVQGLDKIARQLDPRDPAKMRATLVKGGIGILAPTVIFGLMNKGNADYASLDNRTKDNNYIIPYNGTLIKIPKAREYGIMFGSLFERLQRLYNKEDNSFKGFANTLNTNFAPADAVTDNILNPVSRIMLKSNKDFANRDIVPRWMLDNNLSPRLQFDETTSKIAIALGKATNMSPKQIDYLAKSYLGVISQIGIPATSANGGAVEAVTRQYKVDPLYSNQAMVDFYDNIDALKRKASDKNVEEGIPSKAVTKEEAIKNAMVKRQDRVTQLNARIKKATSEEEKRALRLQILNIAKESNKWLKGVQ